MADIIDRGIAGDDQTGDNLYDGAGKINAKFEADDLLIAANTAKDGITTDQANDIVANNSKVGITTQQAADITTNNSKINDVVAGTNVTIDKTDPLNPIISSVGVTGGGDMEKATYDPNSVEGDAFDMANMVEGVDANILTDEERVDISTNKSGIQDLEASQTVQDGKIANLEANQSTGSIAKQTLAEIQALTPDVDTLYYVLDDPDPTNNGQWGWDGVDWYQGADTVNSGTFDDTDNIIPATQKSTADYINSPQGEVAEGETLAVSGGKIYDWFEDLKKYSYGLNKAHLSLVVDDKAISSGGAIIDLAGYKIIGIPVVENEVLTFGNFTIAGNNRYAFYNNETFVSVSGLFSTALLPVTDTVPLTANLLYITIKQSSNTDAEHANLIINEGDTLIPYIEPTRQVKSLNDDLIEAIKLGADNEVPTPSTDLGATNKKYVDLNVSNEINTQLNNELFDFSKNLYDKSIADTPLKYLDANGIEKTSTNTSITYYIKLKQNQDYNYRDAKGTNTYAALYDLENNFIRSIGGDTFESFTTTTEEYFIRVTVLTANKDIFMLEEGFAQSPYEEYSKILKPELINVGWWDNLPSDAEIILINTGQSNSVGAEANASFTAAELAETTNIKVWNNATLSWDNQHLAVTTVTSGWNAIISSLVTKYPVQFKMINGGVSGSGITTHIPSGVNYTNLWTWTQNAINNVLANGKRPYVYFIYIQGEHDALGSTDANAYSDRLTTLVNQWRTNLGVKLPIIQGGIYEEGANIAFEIIVNNTKRRQYADNITNQFYEVLDFPTDDNIHRDRDGYILEANEIISKIDNIGIGLEIVNELPYNF